MDDIRRLHDLMPTTFSFLGGEPELEVPEAEGRHPLDSGWIPLFAFVLSAALTAIVLSSGLRLMPAPMQAGLFTPVTTYVPCVYLGQGDCVIDGATFRSGEEMVRLADIEVPAIAGAACRAEALRGERAMRRLLALLNAGPFLIEPIADPQLAAPGPLPRIASRDGVSFAKTLIAEGHAVAPGAPRNWC